MPAIQVLQNQSATLEIASISQSSSCTVSVYKPTGSAIVSDASATLDATSATITSQEDSKPGDVDRLFSFWICSRAALPY